VDEEGPKAGSSVQAPAPAPDAAVEDAPVGDRALVLGPVDDKSFAILRKRSADAPLEAGVVRPMREGEPISGELVSLERADASAPVFDVKVHYDGRPTRATDSRAPTPALPHKGPARVTSDAFRAGWDAVFDARKPN
jgi:hypothetical protein